MHLLLHPWVFFILSMSIGKEEGDNRGRQEKLNEFLGIYFYGDHIHTWA